MRAGTFRRSENRAQIMRICDTIQKDDKGVFSLCSCRRKNILHLYIIMRGNQRNHALMVLCLGKLVQLLAAYLLNDNAFFCRLCNNPLNRALHVALLHHNLFDISAAAQHLQHGISTLQLIFVQFSFPSFFSFQKRPSSPIFYGFIHTA